MAEVETSTLVNIGIGLLVLVVIAMVIYSALNYDEVKAIAKEVFQIETQEQINTKTEDSVLTFSSDLDGCYNGVYDPNNKDNCFCFQNFHGYIQDDSYITIQNSQTDSTSKLTTLTANGDPLSQIEKPYQLGLMVTSKGYQLGCVFPEQFFLLGQDDDVSKLNEFENLQNNWYAVWKDERLKFLMPWNDDYTFGFYQDGTSKLRGSPVLYRLDSTHYCLVTKLIDEPVAYFSSEFKPLSISSNSKSEYYSSVEDFLLNGDLYCHKL